MAFVTLYSYNPTMAVLRTVYYDSTNPTYINYTDHAAAGTTPQPPANTTMGVICFGVDQYTYKVQVNVPYAYYTKLSNARECGYVPPTCDIFEISSFSTDQTAIGVDDGTVNMFCTTSYQPLVYYLYNDAGFITSNSTGYFTGLAPGNYHINAIDTNECVATQLYTILAFSNDYTHFKYRLLFKDRDENLQWELQLYDTKHNYLKTDYPKDIEGTDDPVVYKCSDQNEDKTTAIVSSNLTLNLWYTGLDFLPDEFTTAPEQTWYVQLLNGAEIFFKGWVIPDESVNQYMDAPYPFILTATDGLPSLKGNSWGNGSGGQGFGNYQVQQYGLAQWCNLVKQCLDQLGYDYGNVKLISSLRYNGTYDSQLWVNIGTWSDILYDSSGVALDTYSALEILLQSLRLTIIPYRGSFVLINWNDLWYLGNAVVNEEFERAFYTFSTDMSHIVAVGTEVAQPILQQIGFGWPVKPIHPPQSLNYDKAYNIEVDASFNILALLFENPSFEIGSVQGELPNGIEVINQDSMVLDAYANYDPVTDTNLGAYDGNWELRIWRHSGQVDNSSVRLINPIPIDQLNKNVNVTFFWRPSFGNSTRNAIIGFVLTFIDSNGDHFVYNYGDGHDLGWIPDPFAFFNCLIFVRVTDNVTWTQFNQTTTPLPGTGIGELNFRLESPLSYDGIQHLSPPDDYYVDVDYLQITLGDAAPSISLQTGEKHTMTVVTGLPQAQLKTIESKLFTFQINKRVAGNVFYGFDYATAPVLNKWNFALKSLDPQDRLAATVARSIARNYAFQMLKFQGEATCPVLEYFGMFQLKYYDGIILMPFSIEGHLRLNIWGIVGQQVSDADSQEIYTYVPIYARNARNNS